MKKKDYVVEKGTEIYYRIKPELDKKYRPDQTVVIDIHSGDYYVADDGIKAADMALKDHPNGRPFFIAFVHSAYGRL